MPRGEEAARGADVGRAPAGEQHLGGRPVGPAQRAHDVAGDGDRALADLLAALDAGRVDRVGDARHAVLRRQHDHGGAVVQVQVQRRLAEGGAHVRRLADEQPDQAQ